MFKVLNVTEDVYEFKARGSLSAEVTNAIRRDAFSTIEVFMT